MMVDVGANTLVFWRAVIAKFKPNHEPRARRRSDLKRAFDILGLKHLCGGPEEAIEALKGNIEEARAARRIW